MQILKPTEVTSETFQIIGSVLIRLEGTVNDSWSVESKRREDDTAEWVPTKDSPFAATVKETIVPGAAVLEYRINLGDSNEGPTGWVYDLYTRVH